MLKIMQHLYVYIFAAHVIGVATHESANMTSWPSYTHLNSQAFNLDPISGPFQPNILSSKNQSRDLHHFWRDYYEEKEEEEEEDYAHYSAHDSSYDTHLDECEYPPPPDSEDYPYPQLSGELPRAFVVGGVVPDEETAKYSAGQITVLNFERSTSSSHMTLYVETVIESPSPFVVVRDVCARLVSKQVAVIIAAGGRNSSAHTAAISYTAGFYHLPVLSTSVRDSSFSNKNLHASLLRTVPPYSSQAAVWIRLLERFSFSQVVFILSADPEGRATLRNFHKLVKLMHDEKKVKVSSTVEFAPGSDSVTAELLPLQNSTVRVYILAAGPEDSVSVLRSAVALDLVSASRVWLVSEAALWDVTYVPRGVVGVRLLQQHDLRAHLSDSLRIAAMALKEMLEEQPDMVTSPPSACCQDNHWNITGPLLYRYMKKQELLDGLTGRVAFDNNGDRIFEEYEIVNAKEDNKLEVVGRYFLNKTSQSMELELTAGITWPGGLTEQPLGYSIPSHLKVLSLEDKPFLMVSKTPLVNGSCDGPTHVPCHLYSGHQILEGVRCCCGYCVHLLQELSRASNFTFDLYVSNGTEYGARYYSNGTVKWNGLIGDLLQRRHGADIIAAALTINPERAQVIDFSKPFKYQGIAILVKSSPMKTSNVSIVQPFRESLWIILLVSVHIIALCVWLLDRCSPMYKCTGSDSDSLTLSEACWLSWGVLLNSGMNEGTPRSLSARVLTLIWAGFAMILLASYTANLAAFLVLEEHTDAITGITDPKLRNPSENFTFGTVAGSAVDSYFRQKIELSNMYRVMNRSNVGSAEEGVNALLNGSLKAFIWDSSRLEYEASRDCSLATVGDLFGRSGYGIGLTRGSPWADKITLDILHFHESGLMAKLDNRWIWSDIEKDCPLESDGEPLQLGLTNIEGMFFMVVGATVTGTILVFVEICWKRFSIKKAVQKKALATLSAAREHVNEETADQINLNQETFKDFGIPEVALFDHKCRGGVIQNGTQKRFGIGRETQRRAQIPERRAAEFQNTPLQKIGERLSKSPSLPLECKKWTNSEWIQFYLRKIEGGIEDAVEISDFSTLASLMHAREVLSDMKQASELTEMDNIRMIQVKKLSKSVSTDEPEIPFVQDSRLSHQTVAEENCKSRHFTVQVELHQHPTEKPNLMNENHFEEIEEENKCSADSVKVAKKIPCLAFEQAENMESMKDLSSRIVDGEDSIYIMKDYDHDHCINVCEAANIEVLPDVVEVSVVKEDC